MRGIWIIAVLALVAGCDRGRQDAANAPNEEATVPATQSSSAMSPAPTSAPSDSPTAVAADGRVSRYTSLAACTLVRERPEEAGFAESRCPGLGGYGLRLVDADARQNLFVEQPGGAVTSLRLSELGGGGFSSIGQSIEWRGAAKGADLAPDAIILRYNVVENPTSPGSETSYLIVVSLSGGAPCVTDRIAPGPHQNERARTAADDADRACLP
ncbi:MAG TPA: hypothetical protein VM657_01940 [Sphingomonas sp.]|nr:hypothetical protein [Sphingomonas sp.]